MVARPDNITAVSINTEGENSTHGGERGRESERARA